ncbi:hypothetical protein [Streptomyces sp. NPDC058861]|uniref:hypothetical protein n=1 Tax=Streptomyces sp. NPDC058861 TaxID=3346653 RepID=UPI0036BB6E2C
MTSRTAFLLAAAPAPAMTAAAALAFKAGSWQLDVSRHEIRLTSHPRPNCPDCRGSGGWWSDGPYPDAEACWCWDRPTRTLHLLPRPPWDDEPPF